MIEIKNETKDENNTPAQEVKTDKEEKSTEVQEIKTEINENVEEINLKKGSKTKIIIIISVVFILIIAILSTIFAVVNSRSEKIIKGITIGKIDVSNLTKEEAKKVLEEIYASKMDNQIYLTRGEFETSITYQALEVNYQIENAIKKAYEIGREGNIFKDNIDILNIGANGTNIEIDAIIDNDMISQISQNINNNIEDAVVQSSYYIENDKLIITSGKEGVKVNEKQLLEDIYKIVDEESEKEVKIEIPVEQAMPEKVNIEKIHEEVYKEVKDAYYTKEPFTVYPEENGVDFDVEAVKAMLIEEKEEYEVQLKITKPNKTVNDIGTEAFPDLLGTCSTKYQASNVNRTTNLKLAVNKINGKVLLPNQEFSYNKALGERTVQAGYKNAAVFSNGKVVDGIGGGICQISSTLYDAVVMANLNVTTRRNHQFVTSYLPAGKDATVVWGSQDFKFVNSRKYPVRITATVQGGVATVQIWGVKEEVEYDISIETKKIATIPFTTQYVQDPSLPAGQQKVVQAGSNGRKVEAYKVTRLNGKVVSTTLLSRDTYNAMKKIVHVGAQN